MEKHIHTFTHAHIHIKYVNIYLRKGFESNLDFSNHTLFYGFDLESLKSFI